MEKKDLLDKWLNGELTPEEFEVFRTIPEFSSYLRIQDFIEKVELPQHDVDQGLIDLNERKAKKEPKVISMASLIKIAAVLTLLLASYLFVSNYEIGTSTQIAQNEIFLLPDDSKVTLNEFSRIELKRFNWGNNRTVKFQGEAYFEVEEGSTFTVETEQGSITVLGTKFNVAAFENSLNVECFEGLVRIIQDDISIDIPAGRSVNLVGGELFLADIYTTEPGWIYDESRFEDSPIAGVISVLKSEYGLNVVTENIDVNLRFTGGFPNNDLEAALQAITLPLGLNYTIENKDAITIFGTDTSD
ncbi:FecR domain-containing protein [Aureitalea sp. L0-47]|uniref:FecR family protein n=1 Tax=Aureitalea sp. L0-47 TaxID=2816962 RepID=UPI002237AC47|nr:FecR domain-containing protein [Aureitalea sp. L0-47]MCW5521027.1 FecR domain-containing protein [Aureitalea sp. L0-47]